MFKSIRGPKDGRDQLDEDTSRFTQELYPLIEPDKQVWFKSKAPKFMGKYGFDEGKFDPKNIWPKCFGAWIQKESKQVDLIRMVKDLRPRFRLMAGDPFNRMREAAAKGQISANDYENNYLGFAKFLVTQPALKKMTIPNFTKESFNRVLDGIYDGRHVIISRVLETNAEILSNLVPALYLAEQRGGKQFESLKVEIVLADNKLLPSIAEKESIKAKDRSLEEKRGISKNGKITALRHLRQHAGTLAAIYLLKSEFDDIIEFYLNTNDPTARCNVVYDSERNFVDWSYFVGMESWDIGLDSFFYQASNPSWAEKLKDEALSGTKNLSNDKIRNILSDSMEMELNILSEMGWEETENEIIMEEKISSRKDGTKRKSPLIPYYIGLLDTKIQLWDIMALIQQISEEQTEVDRILMAKLRLKVGE